MPTTEEIPVVIIGAGAAGLTLATLLDTAKVPCIVLERQDRIGSRPAWLLPWGLF